MKQIDSPNSKYVIVLKEEDDWRTSPPTYAGRGMLFLYPRLKFRITLEPNVPFLSLQSGRATEKVVEICNDHFPSLRISYIDELPFRKYVWILLDKYKVHFVLDMIRHVILPNEFVRKIEQIHTNGQIYNDNVDMILLGKYGVIFEIPQNVSVRSVYRSKSFSKYFDLSMLQSKPSNWREVQERNCLRKVQVGYTRQQLDGRETGAEIGINISYSNDKSFKYYAFIPGIKSLQIKDGNKVTWLQLYTPEIAAKVKEVLSIIANQHPGFQSVDGGTFFDEEFLLSNDAMIDLKRIETRLHQVTRFRLMPNGVFEEVVSQVHGLPLFQAGGKNLSWFVNINLPT